MKDLKFKTGAIYRFLKPIIFIVLLIFTSTIYSQTLTIDDTKTTENLINQLIDNSCIDLSEIEISSNKSVATFKDNTGRFNISEGIIIRSGIAKNTEGTYDESKHSSEVSLNGDTDLQTIIDNEGASQDLTDAAFLELEFIPIGNTISFDYIFASNDYFDFNQCESRDVFAIILTNLETNISKNISTITNTNESISVLNINNPNYGLCGTKNVDLFDTSYINNSDNSIINMKGFTTKLKASADVIPNARYKIKFVIADYANSTNDSAVFIEAGTFDNSLFLGNDEQLCAGEEFTIDSGFYNTEGFNFNWKKDGNDLPQNETTLTVDNPGTYKLTITSITDSSCVLSDEITITSLTAPILENIKMCTNNTTYNIPNEIDSKILNGLNSSNYTINYFESEENLNNNIPITNPSNYTLTQNSTNTIWAKLFNNVQTTCFYVVNFNVTINPKPLVDNLNDVYTCSQYELKDLTNGDYYTSQGGNINNLIKTEDYLITAAEGESERTIYIYNKNTTTGCSSETSFTIFFIDNYNIEILEYCYGDFTIPDIEQGAFYTKTDGPNGDGILLEEGKVLDEGITTIHFYTEIDEENCIIQKEFEITITPLPEVDIFNPVVTCEAYTLKSLTNGSYNTKQDGTGNQLNAGDNITNTQTIYIYNKDSETECENYSTLEITIINPDVFNNKTECANYTITTPAVGNYYTTNIYTNENIIPNGTIVTATQEVYYYTDQITTLPNCIDTGKKFTITINPLPKIDTIKEDDKEILRCIDDPYILPKLVIGGEYYTDINGTGDKLEEGSEISTSQTIYIYKKNSYTNCFSQDSFKVIIKPIPKILDVSEVKVCQPFQLPALSFGAKFYSGSGGPTGGGTEIASGSFIYDTQDIYIFNQDIDIATCYNEKMFTVNILGKEVDEFEDQIACESYQLLELTKQGNYFENDDRTGLLHAGDIITETQTIYIIGDDGAFEPCQNISSFTINVFTEPNLEELGVVNDIKQCGSVTLPSIPDPDIIVEYYSDENRTDLITDYTITNTSLDDNIIKTIYVKAFPKGNPDCISYGRFSITIYHLLELNIQDGTICIDYDTNETNKPFLIKTELDASVYDIKWFLDGNLLNPDSSMADWSATKVGVYKIEAIRNNNNVITSPENSADCNYFPTEVIIESSTPKFEIDILSDNFSDIYSLEINTIEQGLGNYTYSLDNINFQTSNYFNNIKPGTYTAIIRDLEKFCDDIEIEFTALNNPEYFDPQKGNWNITDLKDDATATIDIFDRFGIHIKTIKPSGEGWNGLSNNGKRMPSTDYWYILKYTNQDGNPAIFRSHFSLIRK